MERGVQLQFLLDDGHEDVDRHGDPDLGFDGVLGGAVKGLDTQVLLDPFEEQFDSPPAFVESADGLSRQGELIAEEDELFAGLRVMESDTAQV